ncbi:MAG: PqqD family protein [Oscillospiraceae bacterium]|nr:PqqD family protein [Oscillospiraceae bacterium]
MKVNHNFVLRRVGDRSVAVPVGGACRAMQGVVKLNDTAALVWQSLLDGDTEEQTIAKMLAEYDVTDERARAAYHAAVARLAEIGAVTDDA